MAINTLSVNQSLHNGLQWYLVKGSSSQFWSSQRVKCSYVGSKVL